MPSWALVFEAIDSFSLPGGIARSKADALEISARVGYPVVVRPSYVLGGRAMEIVYDDQKLQKYLVTAVEVDPERPVLVDKYLMVSCTYRGAVAVRVCMGLILVTLANPLVKSQVVGGPRSSRNAVIDDVLT